MQERKTTIYRRSRDRLAWKLPWSRLYLELALLYQSAPDTQDVAQLDVWSFNLRSCSDELGQFVSSEVVSNGP